MQTKFISDVALNMINWTDSNGLIPQVSKATRQAAIDSASKLGLTLFEHSEIMTYIADTLKEYEGMTNG